MEKRAHAHWFASASSHSTSPALLEARNEERASARPELLACAVHCVSCRHIIHKRTHQVQHLLCVVSNTLCLCASLTCSSIHICALTITVSHFLWQSCVRGFLCSLHGAHDLHCALPFMHLLWQRVMLAP